MDSVISVSVHPADNTYCGEEKSSVNSRVFGRSPCRRLSYGAIPTSRPALALCKVVAVLTVLLCLISCKPDVRDRPPGFIRLAPVWDLVRPETIVERSAVVVRYDDEGFSVMSTLSTYDLSRLQRRRIGEEWRWVSKTDESEFAEDGAVLHGPAVASLPYYELMVDLGGVDSTQPDTLYAKLGSKKPSTYRFKPPVHLLTAPPPTPTP